MRIDVMELDLPGHLDLGRRTLLEALDERNDAAHGVDFGGLIPSGSGARGMDTERSDFDVYVVLTEEFVAGRSVEHSAEIDEIPISLGDLRAVPLYGTEAW